MTSLRLAPISIPERARRWAWLSSGPISALAIGAIAGQHPLTALLILIFVAGTYLVILQPFYGAMGLAILAPISSATKRGLLVPHLRLSEALIIWLAPLVILFARRPVKRWSPLEWLGLAYALGAVLLGSFDLWRRGAPLSSSNVDTMLGPFLYLLLLRATRSTVSTERQMNLVVRGMLLTAVPICALALLQGFGVAWAQNLAHNLTGVNEGHLDRAIGVFTNWQVLAGYLLAVGLLAVAVAAYGVTAIVSARAAVLLSVLIGLALARTLTIGALVGWLVGSGALLVMSGRIRLSAKRMITVLLASAAVVALVLVARYHQEFVGRPGQASNGIIPNTVMDRIHNWTQQYLPALSGRWVTGYGPGVPANVTWKFTDSVYVTVVLRGGLILLGLYAALMVAFAAPARARLRIPGSQAFAAAALLVLVALLLPLQILATYFTTSGLPEVTWILAGLVSIGSLVRPSADA